MKILHVTQNYYPSVGGPQYTMKHVSEKLLEYYGDNVQVCTTNSMFGPESTLFQKIEPAVEEINGVEVHRLPFNRWHYPFIKYAGKVVGKLTGKGLPESIAKKRWGLDSPAIDKMMSAADVDLIMATTILYNFADYPMWRNTTSNPKPFVLYGAIHLHKPISANSSLIARAKGCDCYIANTEFERQELIKYGADGRKIVTIGTGIELDNYHCNEEAVQKFKTKHNIKPTDTVIGFIGRLVKGKGVAILIEALRKMVPTNPNLKLVLAGGTTEYVPIIKKAIEEEGLPIVLIENFDESEKAVIYHSLDAFVLASQSESFGVVFLEAWACKKPVIGTRMGAIESLLNEGVDSLLFEAGDSDSLVSQLQKLIEDKGLQQRLGEQGHIKVQNNYTWPVIVERYRNAYLFGIENFNRKHKKSLAVG